MNSTNDMNLTNDMNETVQNKRGNSGAWKMRLEYEKGLLVRSEKNCELIIANDENLQGIVFNELADQIEIRDDIHPVPWNNLSPVWRDADDSQLLSWLEWNYTGFGRENYYTALQKVTDDRRYHPIRDYLNRLPAWDQVPRVDTLLIDCLGSPDNEYVRQVTRKTLCAAVMRVFTPGVKFDSLLVLKGPQGIGKSTLIARLAQQWFNDDLCMGDMKDKCAAEKLQNFWIIEISELAGMKNTGADTLKSFVSRTSDNYRPAYGRRVIQHPRQCIFFGTTNEEAGFLQDPTGNRRFWPVECPGKGTKKSWDLTQEEVDQIWAEVLTLVRQEEPLHLTESVEAYARNVQQENLQGDEREGIILEFLKMPLPDDWNEMPVWERHRIFENRTDMVDGNEDRFFHRRRYVCAAEIWCEAFGEEVGRMKRQDSDAIIAILLRNGWKRPETKTQTRMIAQHGKQRYFISPEAVSGCETLKDAS